MPEPTAAVAEHRLLGVRVHTVTVPELMSLITRAVAHRERFVMVSQNLHSVYVAHRDQDLQRAQALANCVRIDGMPIVLFGRWLGLPIRRKHRTGWMDLLDPFMREAAERSWRVHYVGSKPGVAERGAAVLRERFPGLTISTDHGYFPIEPGDDAYEAVLERIGSAAPDVLIVGMGMPRQERFVVRSLDRLDVPVVLTAGACMDYVAGVVSVPPRWLGLIGLEWAYRLAGEPRRMWRRYLVEPWFAVGLFVREFGARRFGRRH